MSKVEIRKKVLEHRKNLSVEYIKEQSEKACKFIMDCDKYKEADIILSYMSIDGEIDFSILNEVAINNGKKVYIPKVLGKHHMEFFRFDLKNLSKGKFGILEPDNDEMLDLDSIMNEDTYVLMIVPGVAFDNTNNRCGYGGGFYDNYLLRIKEKSLMDKFFTFAPCYDFQLVEKLEEGEFDQKVDEVMVID